MADRSIQDAVGNAQGSLLKTLKPSRLEKKVGVSPEATRVVELKQVTPTEGFGKFPVVQPSTVTPADFYRRGKVGPPNAVGVVNFEEQPRAITEFSSEEKEASIRVVGKLKKSSKTQDQDLVPPFTKFLLESISEAHTERSQIVETFGDFYVFFFGERPPIYTFSGTMVNTKYASWVQDFMFYYEKFLRGTRSVENNARIVLTYGGRQVEGFILNVSTQTNAATENGSQFSFQVLILDRKILQVSADFGLVEADGKFNNDTSFLDILAKAGLSVQPVSKAWNGVRAVMNSITNPASSAVPTAGDAPSLGAEYGKSLIPSSLGGIQLA